jgi:GT2 family glycosyltransferase
LPTLAKTLAEGDTRLKPPKVAVIILNWNGREVLAKCLDSVIRTDYPNLEIVVVDNASTDTSQAMVRDRYPGIRLVENRENLGYVSGNNVGIGSTRSDYVVLLNNDTTVDRAWIRELVKAAATDERIGVLGCKVYLMGTRIIQHAGSHLSFVSGSLFTRSMVEDRGQFDEVADVDYVSGEAIMIKREVLKKVGLLDPDYYAYWEDADFCWRARRRGYRVVYVPSSVVEHMVSASWDKRPIEAKVLGERNRILFILKNFPYHHIIGILILEPVHIARRMVDGAAKIASTKDSGARAAILGRSQKTNMITTVRIVLEWPLALLSAYAWNIRRLRTTLASRRSY